MKYDAFSTYFWLQVSFVGIKKTNKHINIGLISNAINRNIEKVKYNRFYIKHTNHQLNSITNMFELIQWFDWKNIGEDRR